MADSWFGYRLKYREIEASTQHSLESELIFVNEELHKTYIAGAVDRNDVNHLRLLLSNTGIAYVDVHSDTLLHDGVFCYSLEAFECLLNTPGVEINALNNAGETPLYVACRPGGKYKEWALSLISHGADVNMAPPTGKSPLHHVIDDDSIEVGRALIENGADLNARDPATGETPLSLACKLGRLEFVSMLLLCYGVDVSIDDFYAATAPIQEFLFDFVFDENERTPLSVCVFAKHCANGESGLAPKLFETATDVDYGSSELGVLRGSFLNFLPNYFRLFLEKFDYAVRDMLREPGWGLALLSRPTCFLSQNLRVLTESHLISELVDALNRVENLLAFVFPRIVQLDGGAALISTWLVRGLKFDSCDVDNVYVLEGFSIVFKQMLAMDFDISSRIPGHLMPRLIYDFKTSLDEHFEGISRFNPSTFGLVSAHFADDRFKKLFASEKVEVFSPRVPRLVELARNVARRHVVDTFEIQNYRQFREILDRLGVPRDVVKILTYERKLYSF